MELQDLDLPISAIIHDRDYKFTSQFDVFFTAEGSRVALTPYRSPRANSFVERRRPDWDSHTELDHSKGPDTTYVSFRAKPVAWNSLEAQLSPPPLS
jgi:hypothetical protein